VVRCCRESAAEYCRQAFSGDFPVDVQSYIQGDLLNRSLHKERTITHWLSFDEPESRLRKAIKRERFFREFCSVDRKKFDAKLSQRLAALAFAISDVELFDALAFKRAANAFYSNKFFESFNAKDSLEKIHRDLASHLEIAHSWTADAILWAALCVDFLAESLAELQADCSNSENEKFDALSFLITVSNRIESQIESTPVTACGALIDMALEVFDEHHKEMQTLLPPDFLPAKLLLVEGQTEAILVPVFAQLHDFEFSDHRILMIAGGGANQVAKRFLSFREATEIPIACLLDGDAESQFEIISQHMRNSDVLFRLPSGEFEDTFEITRFVQLLNRYLQSMTGENAPSLVEFEPLKKEQFPPEEKRTQVLNKIWREKSLGNFDKVEFAEFVAQTIKTRGDVPYDFSSMIEAMEEKWGDER